MKKILSVLLLITLVYAFISVLTFLSVRSAIASAKKVSIALKTQDLDTAKAAISETKGKFQNTKGLLYLYTPIRIIPFLGWYVADAQRGVSAAVSGLSAAQTLTTAVTPYADILGLKGKGTFLGGTAQERLSAIIETLSKVAPQLDSVGKDLKDTRKQIDNIEPWRYPNFLPGRPGEKIKNAKDALDQVETFISQARPLIEVLPDIMGQTKEKNYIILIQNDKELRPTGGFISAYSQLKVNKGNIQTEGSEDIYKLDEQLRKLIPAPKTFQTYLHQNALYLRDSNISPDFVSSMNLFQGLYNTIPGRKNYDGIIAIDTRFVLNMLDVLGPIEVGGTKFSTTKVDSCACPQIIYQLELYADQPVGFEKGDRKAIIGPLMQQMMAKTFSAPQSSWPKLVTAVLSALQNKDLLLYFKDVKSQEAAERVNFAGRIHQYDGDYLAINEANLGGAKSNLYIEEKVKQQVKKDKDTITNKLTIEYKYPRRGDNCSLERKGGLCLAGIYQDWIRIYVPKGAKITKAGGADVPFTVGEDLEKTIFEGFIKVRPEGTAKIEIEYTVPVKPGSQYKLLIQKQPGTPFHSYEIDAFGKREIFQLDTDKEFIVKI